MSRIDGHVQVARLMVSTVLLIAGSSSTPASSISKANHMCAPHRLSGKALWHSNVATRKLVVAFGSMRVMLPAPSLLPAGVT